MYYFTKFESTKETVEGLLRMFKCQRCRPSCCTKVKDGIVVTSGDIKRLAKHLKISRHEFKERYTFIKDGEVRMPCPCPFYSEDINGCTVHEFRPQVCRKFPFNKTHEINGKRFITICGDCPAGKEVAKGPVAVMPESVEVG